MSTEKAKKPPSPQPPYDKTTLPGPSTIVKVIEDLRTRDSDGYSPYSPGFLARVKGMGGLPFAKGTVCSPFTANVIGCAFDPDYDKKDIEKDTFVPMFNGGKDELPFSKFYVQHNNDDHPAQSVATYNLGRIVKPKEIRRGDMIGIDWAFGGGHAVFCWDVHLDANGDVDCFQYVGANGHLGGASFVKDDAGLKLAQTNAKAVGGRGVSISGCDGKTWLTGDAATWTTDLKDCTVTKKTKVKNPDTGKMEQKSEQVPGVKVVVTARATEGNLKKAKDKIFDEKDEDLSKKGYWYTIPGVKKSSIDPKFAKGRVISESVGTMHCATFHYATDPPAPAVHKEVAPVPPPPTPKTAGHTEAPAQVVKGEDLKQNPRAKDKVPPKPAKQESDKTLFWQHFVEHALQVFYAAKWIDKDPGSTDDLNDPKTQAAIKAYQTTFKLKVDGKIGPQTLGSMEVELPICVAHVVAQHFLRLLFDGKKLDTDPGIPDGTNNDKTKAALEEFQKKQGLPVTKVPDSATHRKLAEVVQSHAPTEDKPGLNPAVSHLYWVGNTVDPGGTARLRLHSVDLKVCETCTIHLHDDASGKDADASVTLTVDQPESEVGVPIPFPAGASVQAKVVTQSAGEIFTVAALHVGRGTEPVDWRPYIGQDSVPDDLVAAIERNRARWPAKTIALVTKGKYAGPKHYNYGPPASHGSWARDYVKTEKVDKATGLADKHIAQVFVEMMKDEKGSEGQPASFQTYDNQIVTWGVGFGGMGDGVYIFDELNKDPAMQRLLDDLGVNYFDGAYQVVDVSGRKVVSSTEITVEKKGKKKHVDWDHAPPLNAWRDQMDLMSAVISISEDPAYRVQILEAQWRVYIRNSSTWSGQDKIYSLALYYLITHSQHWLPAFARAGFFVNREFDAIGGGTPSIETDKKVAQRLLNSFLASAKAAWSVKKPKTWAEVHRRVNDDLWSRFKTDAKKEGFDPGEFVYTVDV
jgi:peptidoglycan hydrolase-like protein with peptidoglycan-binding domain